MRTAISSIDEQLEVAQLTIDILTVAASFSFESAEVAKERAMGLAHHILTDRHDKILELDRARLRGIADAYLSQNAGTDVVSMSSVRDLLDRMLTSL